MITIVNYGMGNLGSVQNMFKRIGVASEVASDVKKIETAAKLLLPGVGAFDTAMEKIEASGMMDALNRKALEEKIPVLGICLGMQLLTESSEEGVRKGLGWIKGKTISFKNRISDSLKIPHMGWNLIQPVKASRLLADLPEIPKFYFVHSFYVHADETESVLAVTEYGIKFHSVVQQGNIFGAQFHPEKSHKFGMKLLENFANL